MELPLLSKITKDFLNQDPDLVSSQARYRMGWSGSILFSHSSPRKLKTIKLLFSLKKLIDKLAVLTTLPSPTKASPLPPRYFSRGAIESDRLKNPEPIWYLLTETDEKTQPRPIPGTFMLLRSICKGKGVLRQNKQGLVYLDINNRFTSSLLPFLKEQGLVSPPYFNLFSVPNGAHIPVIPAREIAFQYLNQVNEIGKEFSFEIEGLYSMQPSSWPEIEQVWFFKIHSPELQDLRRCHFLPALPGGHSFHIAIAIKPSTKTNETSKSLPLMRINVAFLAA